MRYSKSMEENDDPLRSSHQDSPNLNRARELQRDRAFLGITLHLLAIDHHPFALLREIFRRGRIGLNLRASVPGPSSHMPHLNLSPISACAERSVSRPTFPIPVSQDDGMGERHGGTEAEFAELLFTILDRMGCGAVLLAKPSGELRANTNARELLLPALDPAVARTGLNGSTQSVTRSVLNPALAQLHATGKGWVTISRDEGRPLALFEIAGALFDGQTMLVAVDLGSWPLPKASTLRQMFGLTIAEARLAIELAKGGCLADIARRQRVSRATVRTLLSRVFSKTATRGQRELVALLGRIALLP